MDDQWIRRPGAHESRRPGAEGIGQPGAEESKRPGSEESRRPGAGREGIRGAGWGGGVPGLRGEDDHAWIEAEMSGSGVAMSFCSIFT
jgi:hypothetical protein